MSAGKLRIKNWREYQHYANRRPPWLKLHAKILDDAGWRELPDVLKGHLVALWALASRIHDDPLTDAEIPDDPPYLSALTGCRITPKSLNTLVIHGFLAPCKRDASTVLHDSGKSGVTETETETETETDAHSLAGGNGRLTSADFDRFWDHYPRRVAKKDAVKAWKQTANERPPIDALIAKVDELAMSKQWLKEKGEYVPYPATWLRRGGWEDEVRE